MRGFWLEFYADCWVWYHLHVFVHTYPFCLGFVSPFCRHRYAVVASDSRTAAAASAASASAASASASSAAADAIGLLQLRVDHRDATVPALSSAVFSFRTNIGASGDASASVGSGDANGKHGAAVNSLLSAAPLIQLTRSSGTRPAASAASPSFSTASSVSSSTAAASASSSSASLVDQPAPALLVAAVCDLLERARLPLDLERTALMRAALDAQRARDADRGELERLRAEVARAKTRLDEIATAVQCTVCQQNDVALSLAPCGHQMCAACERALRVKKCPFCREPYASTVKWFKPF